MLVDDRDTVLDELLLPPDSLSGSGPLADSYGLHVDEEVEFERHVAIVGVGHLVDQRYTVRGREALGLRLAETSAVAASMSYSVR